MLVVFASQLATLSAVLGGNAATVLTFGKKRKRSKNTRKTPYIPINIQIVRFVRGPPIRKVWQRIADTATL